MAPATTGSGPTSRLLLVQHNGVPALDGERLDGGGTGLTLMDAVTDE
jgi:hypothetical protein